jgi:hypothetical protein
MAASDRFLPDIRVNRMPSIHRHMIATSRERTVLLRKAHVSCSESGVREKPFTAYDSERSFNFPKSSEHAVIGTSERFRSSNGRLEIEAPILTRGNALAEANCNGSVPLVAEVKLVVDFRSTSRLSSHQVLDTASARAAQFLVRRLAFAIGRVFASSRPKRQRYESSCYSSALVKCGQRSILA